MWTNCGQNSVNKAFVKPPERLRHQLIQIVTLRPLLGEGLCAPHPAHLLSGPPYLMCMPVFLKVKTRNCGPAQAQVEIRLCATAGGRPIRLTSFRHDQSHGHMMRDASWQVRRMWLLRGIGAERTQSAVQMGLSDSLQKSNFTSISISRVRAI